MPQPVEALWTIVELESYRVSVYECAQRDVVANGVFPLAFALKRGPKAFLPTGVYSQSGLEIWLAKTKLDLSGGAEIIMSYTLRYLISEKEHQVLLLHVEFTSPDDMNWPDDNQPTF